MSKENTDQLFEKLNGFITKYYQNQLIKGSIYVVSILVIFFLLFAIIEHFSSFGVRGRTFLFWTYIFINLFVLYTLLIIPLLRLVKIGKTLNYKAAAIIIGKHFPEIDDKLLNLLELSEVSDANATLIKASINQKTKKLSPISFENAINLSLNKRHLKWIIAPIVVVLIFIISGKDYILTESSARILKHNTFFEPRAPFNYVILNKSLRCKQFGDFLLKIKVNGNAIPDKIFIKYGGSNFKMKSLGNNEYEYQFERIYSDLSFYLKGGGYVSKKYTIACLLQPRVVNMEINVSHPKHTMKQKEFIKNKGDLVVSEGSRLIWNIQLENSDNCVFVMGNNLLKGSGKNSFTITDEVFKQSRYSIISSNNNSLVDTLSYLIRVVTDKFPKIDLIQSYDTINNIHMFNGIIEDDYLLNKLEFICSYTSNDSLVKSTEEIIIQRKNLENFLHVANFEELKIDAGTELKYYFKVWDNDGVNGSKFAKSQTFTYSKPSKEDLIKRKDLQNEKTKNSLSHSKLLSEKIQKEVKALNKIILEKKLLSWEERQKAKEIIKKQKQLEKHIIETQKNNSKNLKTQEKLNSSILEKQKKLDELMSKTLNNEIKKLIEEIEKRMDNLSKEKLKDLLDKLNKENTSLEKELDRELELFKQLEFEQKVEETLEKITELKTQQKDLKTKTKKSYKDNSELAEIQEELAQKMDQIKKDLEDLREKNMHLENKNNLPKTQRLEQKIKHDMKTSQDALQKNMKRKSEKSQDNALEKIEELEGSLKSMQQSSEEEKPIEDMQTLRKILENLITLSFDQEDLINKVKNTPSNSSEFIKIIKQQNKLSNDSKIIEDSLFALSKRVVQIQATIIQEIENIKSNIEIATSKLEDRDVNRAAKRQQFVMTSANNLALLLSEILEQMQKQLEMSDSKCNKPKNCNKPNPNCKKPSISDIKKAQKKLNGKMQKRGDCQKNGEKKSKELMNLAKQQSQIRQQLMQLRDEMGKNGEKGKIDNALENMEETERDIINNKITQETFNRQSEILTRLLETENSSREQGIDEKRNSAEWKFEQSNMSEKFLEYKQEKKAQEELLKTIPLQLAPFYKKKVNKYFKKLIND